MKRRPRPDRQQRPNNGEHGYEYGKVVSMEYTRWPKSAIVNIASLSSRVTVKVAMLLRVEVTKFS